MKILYEDNHVIVAFKDRGILSQADGTNVPDMLTLLKAYLKEKYNKPGNVYLGLVQRLDRNTSGVMVFAKTSKAAARLNDAIKNHLVRKNYYATVEGTLDNERYLPIISYITKDEVMKKSFVDPNGKQAVLEYKALKNYEINGKSVTDLEIALKTGRFHQIRCQMASINHPLFGDKKYGSKENFEYKLCAYKLTFPHPITNEMLTFSI